MKFPAGKLPHDFLESLLNFDKINDPSVILGPGTGIDCAVLDLGNQYLVVKSDPITFATNQIGWYAVHINANDIVTTGAIPKWFLATILLPEKEENDLLVKDIFNQISNACNSLGISLVGGHTEVTYGINRPIVSGTMIGVIQKNDLIRQDGIQDNDDILLTKGVPIEGISIIAHEFEEKLKEFLDEKELKSAKDFLFTPGISVYKDAVIAKECGGVHAMHDPTEGGLYAALWEMAKASNISLYINSCDISIPLVGKKITSYFNLNPMKTIASGALLIFCVPEKTKTIIETLKKETINCTKIGKAKKGFASLVIDTLPYQGSFGDEINKLF